METDETEWRVVDVYAKDGPTTYEKISDIDPIAWIDEDEQERAVWFWLPWYKKEIRIRPKLERGEG